ncbi:MAG TPA: hydroxymethylbilane synthase [Syntrophorhabdaceae bacterium]|nr:hydroxymethylbilane synthase [Syntrophorhabdaceae bacterium]
MKKMKTRWRIGTRGSRLAIKQTEIVVEKLKQIYPHLDFQIMTIKTKGDTIWDRPLHLIGGKGLFVKEIEEALVNDEIDMAVHSAKDLPTELAKGLVLGAVLEREDPRDAFVSDNWNNLNELKQGARIGTSSLRRKAQLLNLKRDLNIVDLRGNVDTRIRKMGEKDLDGIILAFAGVKRMGLHARIKEIIPVDIMVPAAGQGAIGIETKNKEEVLEFLMPLNHEESLKEIEIERTIQTKIGGGCHVPLGINASLSENELIVHIVLGEENGKILFKERYTGNIDKADEIIETLIKKLPPIKGATLPER